MSLFEPNPAHNLIPQDGVLNDFGCILDLQAASLWFDTLLTQTPWQHDEVEVFGKRIVTARKVAWYGDAAYFYSGVLKQPLPWSEAMLALKALVEHHTGHHFNSCLVNLYENGSQGVGWHSDDETTLGKEPIIASLNLGATRRFCFKHKIHALKCEMALESGQLILMHGSLQRHWLHAIPKAAQVHAARINLTFRQIHSAAQVSSPVHP